jgi:hypothetical protein
MYGKPFVILIFIICFSQALRAQDTLVYVGDSVAINSLNIEQIKAKRFFDPSRAALLSAVMPGLGQAYNKKYWKMPIVWGGLVLGISFANFYNERLQIFRVDHFERLNGQPGTLMVSTRRLEQLIQRYRRDRDQTVIYTFMWYGLNIVDAHVDAYLKEFDVNDELALKLEPYVDASVPWQMNAGVSLVLKFK